MSIQDAVAGVIMQYRYDLPDGSEDTIHNIAADISDAFKKDDSEFDVARFMQLSETGPAGPNT